MRRAKSTHSITPIPYHIIRSRDKIRCWYRSSRDSIDSSIYSSSISHLWRSMIIQYRGDYISIDPINTIYPSSISYL
jgi:hypothetical protein